jgi:hypothetical protein
MMTEFALHLLHLEKRMSQKDISLHAMKSIQNSLQ